ncbi:hypothetical protein GPALN_015634 [Globodera pallida]|nr:hypothetical protein GPALN_015634 [Globodera pallida]
MRDFEKFAENEISLAFVQLEAALSKYGYRFSGTFYAILMSKYDRTRTGCLYFDDFMHLCIVLQKLTTPFSDIDKNRDGRIGISKSLTFAIFLFHQSEMSNLKRFEISDSASKRRAEEFPTHAKQLHEVVEFNSPGQFYVHARIADLQYSLYKACPLRAKGGLPCKRKLDNELFCVSCAHRAKKPHVNLYIRADLEDCDDPEITETKPEKLGALLQSKIGQTVAVKLNIKAKGELGLLDWIIISMAQEKSDGGDAAGDDGEEAQLQQQRRQKTLGSGQAVPTAASQRGDGVVRRTIDEEDETDNHNLGQDNDPSPPLFEEKQRYVHKMERFALQRHVTEFVLNGQNAEPDEALREALDRIIERAVQNTERESGRRVTKLGILLDGRGLSDPIVMPIRPPEQNSADALMAELDKLGQSGGDEDVHGGGQSKRSLLLSEPVQIIVTCLAPPTGAAPRFHHYQHWGYDERQRIRIRNRDDSFCMFYALVAARAYSDQAFLFDDQPEELPRPVWKGSAGRRFNISLFHSEGHYDAIKKIICFFKLGKKYCVDCECTYTVDVKHTMTCKSRCPQCAKVGPQQPCVRDPGVKIQCQQCNRFFFSQSCFDTHLQGQTCSLLKRCHACSRTYQFDAKRPHKCYTSYCARCKVYHEKDAGCFIKKISIPRERQKYRILCWDTETRLEALEAGQQRHKVNHLSAQITCTECCDSPTGDRQNCEICVTDEGEMCRAKDCHQCSICSSSSSSSPSMTNRRLGAAINGTALTSSSDHVSSEDAWRLQMLLLLASICRWAHRFRWAHRLRAHLPLLLTGYRFSGTFYAILMSKYDRTRTGCLYFDDFMHLCIVLQKLTTPFSDIDKNRDGRIGICFEEFITKSLTFAIFLFHQSEMSNLKRFEISDSASKRRAEEFPTHAKQLHEVVEFNSPGQFYVHARIADLQYSLYKACPLRAKGGLPCKRKLDNELFCVSCAHRAKKPHVNLYIRADLEDCDDPEITETKPEKLGALLQSKIGQTVAVKLNIKAKGELGLLDWIIISMAQEKSDGGDAAGDDGEEHLFREMKRVADTGKNPPSPSLPPGGSSTPATRNSKFGRWDFRSMTHFEQHPSGEMDGENKAQLQQQRRQKTLGSGQAVPTAASQRGDGVVRRTIDEEDETDNHNLGQDNDPSPPLFEEKQHYVHKMERFALQRHVTEFVLNGQNAEPDEALREALDRIIERAVQNTERESGRRVTKLGILLDGRGLSDPIVMPIRPPEQNSADALMAELDKLGQSGGDEDVHGGGQSKRSLLPSEPVQIIVTCLAPPTGAAPRFHHYQHWGYDERQRIRIRNRDDSFCMFYALVAARAYSDQAWLKLGQQTDNAAVARQLMSRPDFCINQTALNNLLSNGDKMRRAATNLMEQSGIDAALEAYGMEHLQMIQHYWDQAYPGMYRVVLFDDQPEELPRPVWKGSAGRRFNISLFHSEGHYDAIKKINCFFKLGKKYCVDYAFKML